MRTYVTPTQPETVNQVAVRTLLTALSRRWRDTLTDGQRAGWQTWSTEHLITNRLGLKVKSTALGCYVGLGMICSMKHGNDPTAAFSDAPFSETSPQEIVAIGGLQDMGGGSTRVYANISTAPGITGCSIESRLLLLGSRQVNLPYSAAPMIAGVGAGSFRALLTTDAGTVDCDYTPTLAAVTGSRYLVGCQYVTPSGQVSLPVTRVVVCS